jgi:hypothetical protein
VGALIASVSCSSTKHETPASPTPTLTASMVAASLGAELNTSIKAALVAGAGGREFAANCSRGGNIRITNLAPAPQGQIQMSGTIVSVTACGHSLNGRDVLASGPLTANGSWSASAPDSPVRLTGDVNVPDLGVITVIGSTGATFNGTIGGVAVGTPTNAVTTTTTTAGSTTTTTVPAGTTPTNIGGTWVVPGQSGNLVITQNGTALTCVINGLPAGTTQDACAGSINGSTVTITQRMTAVVTSGPYTTTCQATNLLGATATATTMLGTVTSSGTCTITGPAPLPSAPAVPTTVTPVAFVKQ